MIPKDIIVNGRVDLTKFPLPQVYLAPNESLPGSPLHSLKLSMPVDDGFVREFDRPTVHPDGSIEYQRSVTEPDDIDGYQRDMDNRWLFKPIWKDCIYRAQGIKLKTSGCIDVKMACNHPEAETYGQAVNCDTCDGCVLRTLVKTGIPHRKRMSTEARDFNQPKKLADGTLVYERIGFEPPVCPEGYHRNPKDAWSFIPEWQPCADRSFENSVRPCGCVDINAVCHSTESGHENKRVAFITCQGCPVRRLPETFSIS